MGKRYERGQNITIYLIASKGREAEMNVLRDELVGCYDLTFYLRENIKVIEGEVNTSKMELELLRLESERS